MLYLEDYMEMIENLPMEMRDRFTEMREMDLQVQNAMDSLEDRVKKFFEKCHNSNNLKQEWKDEQFKKIKEEYGKALEDADEKVHLTAQVYDLLERYLRKLDMELQKFKLELEADNAGITEILEKRSIENDNPPNNHSSRAEKRKYSQMNNSHNHHRSSFSEKRVNHGPSNADTLLSSLATETVRDGISAAHRNSTSAANSPAMNMFNSTSSAATTPALSYNLGHVGAGSNAAIAAAASRAIGATLEMQQGRRTASLKASYEAVKNAADLKGDFTLRPYTATGSMGAGSGSSAGATGSAGGATRSEPSTPTPSTSSRAPSRKKSVLKNRAQAAQQASQLAQQLTQPVVPTPTPPPEVPEVAAEETSVSGWAVDPNEPRYCVCNDVSYGEMVGCDNDDCPIEWFHYGCVGLSSAPRGKWYCPQCTVAMKRRGRK